MKERLKKEQEVKVTKDVPQFKEEELKVLMKLDGFSDLLESLRNDGQTSDQKRISRLLEHYRDSEQLLKKPKHFSVVDAIFQIQEQELLDRISNESFVKLKKLNSNIEERLLKGADIIHNKKQDPFDDNTEKQTLINAQKRIKELLSNVENHFHDTKVERET